MATPNPSVLAKMPGPVARRFVGELRHNLEVLEPLFQRGREARRRRSFDESPDEPLWDAAACLKRDALESAFGAGLGIWEGRMRTLYVALVSVQALVEARRAGKGVDVDLGARLRTIRQDMAGIREALAAEYGQAPWRAVADRVRSLFSDSREMAA
ncbi:MAG: hypothetical protein RL026_630 [Pseudomonadota bacterium]|jgi:hypothetical protein